MNCPNCDEEMVVAKATDYGEEYLYCRNCKKELKEIIVLEVPSIMSDMPSLPPQTPCTCTPVSICEHCRKTWFDIPLVLP